MFFSYSGAAASDRGCQPVPGGVGVLLKINKKILVPHFLLLLSTPGHDILVLVLHRDSPVGSAGVTLAGGADCEDREVKV